MGWNKNNKNSEWISKEYALSLITMANSVIGDDCYLLSEVAVECDTYREQFTYIGKKFRNDKDVYWAIKKLTNRCEAIVARKTANSEINTALGIFILKSYHSLIETSKLQHEGGEDEKPIKAIIDLGSGQKPK